MEEDPTAHNAHAKSLAYLSDAGKVSNFQIEQKEHISQNPSDLQQIAEAQVVSTNKVGFVPDEVAPVELQSGPPKKYIDNPDTNTNITDNTQPPPQQQQNAQPLSNFAYSAMQEPQTGQTQPQTAPTQVPQQNNVDSFVPPTDASDKQNYESFFADDSGNVNGNNNAPQPPSQTNASEDIFGGMGMGMGAGAGTEQKQNEQSNDMFGDAMEQSNDVYGNDNQENIEKKEEKQTFLSVWQEQHREQLSKQAKEERESQEKMVETAKEELDNFNEQRRLRIEQQRKDAQSRESDLRQDYDYVYKHGSIWQQVAKLVDLKTKETEIERMRDLLIILKNQDERKSDQ